MTGISDVEDSDYVRRKRQRVETESEVAIDAITSSGKGGHNRDSENTKTLTYSMGIG